MKTKLLGAALALGLATLPLASFAGGVGGGNANSNWTIYGWQNYSWEFVDNDTREFDRINANAANIGFAANIDTGMSLADTPIKANVQCEQFTYYNQLAGGSGWCNRNSKLSLSGVWGEAGWAIWLLPFNEMVAQWVDPFYDAGADSTSSIMGTYGLASNFYNGGTFSDTTLGGDFDYSDFTAYDAQFSRRQDNLLHWWSPNWGGFQARFAMTAGNRDESASAVNGFETDPVIYSTGVTYTHNFSGGDELWLALTYEKHDEWVAASQNSAPNGFGAGETAPGAGDQEIIECGDSDDDAYRIAARYIHDWGNGHSTWISGMYEQISWELDDCVDTNNGNAAISTFLEDLEIEHYLISGKHNFPGPFDFRFSYMYADEWDCGGASAPVSRQRACVEDDTDATAYNLGIFYTMPAGTELRLTYSEVSNEDNATYDFGINGSGVAQGDDVDMIAIGLVQWF